MFSTTRFFICRFVRSLIVKTRQLLANLSNKKIKRIITGKKELGDGNHTLPKNYYYKIDLGEKINNFEFIHSITIADNKLWQPSNSEFDNINCWTATFDGQYIHCVKLNGFSYVNIWLRYIIIEYF